MRWAVNYAINRDQVVKFAYEGTTVPSRHYFPISSLSTAWSIWRRRLASIRSTR